MSDHPIVDAHLHLTDPARVRYPWMAGVPALLRPWSLADYDRLSEGLAVEAFVFVEVDAAPEDKSAEVRLVAEAAAADPRLKGMVAAVAMDRGEATEVALDQLAPEPLLRGVRDLIERHAGEPGWARRPSMIEGVRGLAARGLSFDLCLRHPQMRDAIALVAACPEVRFVLDHLGKPGIRAGLLNPWREDLTALARRPNVWCKVSGVVTEADHGAWTEEDVLPYLAHALSAFGEERVMFGGDWPVSELATRLPRWVTLVERAAAQWGARACDKLWRGNATAFYRLGGAP